MRWRLPSAILYRSTIRAAPPRPVGELPTTRRRLVKALDDHRLSLAAGDAHRLQPNLVIVCLHRVQQRAHDAGAGHPEGVAQGDRPAVGVELLQRDVALV